jgi:hypothetical protein
MTRGVIMCTLAFLVYDFLDCRVGYLFVVLLGNTVLASYDRNSECDSSNSVLVTRIKSRKRKERDHRMYIRFRGYYIEMVSSVEEEFLVASWSMVTSSTFGVDEKCIYLATDVSRKNSVV